VIRVRACGVCRSNLHMIEGDWLDGGTPSVLPIVPGHEVVGVVEQVGELVHDLAVGDRVGVQPIWSTCGVCRYCRSGAEQRCQSKQITGETLDGGYAELMLAKAAYALRIPDGLTDVEAAPLFCPGITAYGAVAKANLSPARTVAVFGIGGVGHVALQFAALTGAHTIAVSRARSHLDLAQDVGVSQVVDASRGDAGEQLKRMGGVDAALVFAPSDQAVADAIAGVRPGGIVVVGVNATIGPFPFADEKTIVGSLLGTRQMMREVLDIAAEGRVHVVTEELPLEQAGEALRRLAAGSVRGRQVLVP
jgi:propanol-preferring alcohol dehydrogenase